MLGLFFLGMVTVSCNDLLEADSDQIVLPEYNQLNSLNDSIYSMVGIYTQLQELADRYVLLGELRGDLMDITPYAGKDIQEIYNFNISKENIYNKASDYYSVINSCNYLINTMDTSLVDNFSKVMMREFAQAKAIRAWCYMQLALNYGEVSYYTQPILDVADAGKDVVKYNMDGLSQILINDLLPIQNVALPLGGISFGSIDSEKMCFNIKYLLGDLYLWQNNYESAAQIFYELIDKEFSNDEEQHHYFIEHEVEDGVFVEDWTYSNWTGQFWLNSGAQLTFVASPNENGGDNTLDSLMVYYPEVQPSDISINNWDSEEYFHSNTLIEEGDLRGTRSYIDESLGFMVDDDIDVSNVKNGIIYKFYYLNMGESVKGVSLGRDVDIYLKFAEAINRLEKPNMAFAVLKYGLNKASISNHDIIPTWEKYSSYEKGVDSVFYSYTDFTDEKYSMTYDADGDTDDGFFGIHSRGSGKSHLHDNYVIRGLNEDATLEDSIKAVEDMIIQEYALEKAFEGNRFQDLMRISKRRGNNSYLADKVSAKYENSDEIRAKLMVESNWYLSSK